MKKYIFSFTFFCLIIYTISFFHLTNDEKLFTTSMIDSTFYSQIKTENISANINNYHLYGQHLNISGFLNIESDSITSVNLLIHGNNDYIFELDYEIDDGLFYSSSNIINDGIFLDNFKDGNYFLYLEVIINNKSYYYEFVNYTNYYKTEYYTLSNNDYCQYLFLNLKKISL